MSLSIFDAVFDTRVLLISRNEVLKGQVRSALSLLGFGVVSTESIEDAHHAEAPHVVLFDTLSATPLSIGALRSRFPNARLLVIGAVEETKVIEAFRAGACGFLTAWEPVSTVSAGIMLLALGGAPVSLPILQIVMSERFAEGSTGMALANAKGLSPRQVEVLQLAGRGLTDREIAGKLGLSIRTVNRHIADALKRLECRNRREAIEMVFSGIPPAVRRTRVTHKH